MSLRRDLCTTCNHRKAQYQMQECSHTACPNRKTLTAAPPDDDTAYHSGVFHGVIRRTIKEEE